LLFRVSARFWKLCLAFAYPPASASALPPPTSACGYQTNLVAGLSRRRLLFSLYPTRLGVFGLAAFFSSLSPFVYWHTPSVLRICLVPSESTPTGLQKPKNYKVSIWWCVSALSLFSPTASRVSSHPLEPPPILTHTIHTRQNSTPPDVLDFPTLPHALVQPFHPLLLFSACAAFQLQAEKRRQQDACCGRPCLRRLRCHRRWDRRLRCGSKPCRMRSPVPALMTGGLRPPLPILVLLPQLGMG